MEHIVLYHMKHIACGLSAYSRGHRLRDIAFFRVFAFRVETYDSSFPSPEPIALVCFIPNDSFDAAIVWVGEIWCQGMPLLVEFEHSAVGQ